MTEHIATVETELARIRAERERLLAKLEANRRWEAESVAMLDMLKSVQSTGNPAESLVGHVSYHPEMGEEKPAAEIEASLSHYGRHWFLHTPLTLSGRGVKRLDTEPQDGQRRAGWHRYKVTEKAFEILSQQHRVVSESLL